MNSFNSPKLISDEKPQIIEPKKFSILSKEERETEVEVYTELPAPKGEVSLPCDALDPLKRRFLIAVHTYGINSSSSLKQIAAFCDLPLEVVNKIIDGSKTRNWLTEELEKGTIPCFTKAELIARLCVEAENAIAPKDRINSISKLMEFRGLTAPEGGSKSFQRIAMKFKTA